MAVRYQLSTAQQLFIIGKLKDLLAITPVEQHPFMIDLVASILDVDPPLIKKMVK